jgi:lipoprotein-anchoring transpeptidase ErfK/SrfK
MRKILFQLLVAVAASAILALALANGAKAREMIPFAGNYYPGTIVIKTKQRRLYYVLGQGYAIRYPVGVGRTGQQWAGVSYIDGKYVEPDWAPPPAMRHDPSADVRVIPGGSPQNPMGVAAMTLTGGEYAIHGTNQPNSVGGFVSSGCIRMLNQDVVDLFQRVAVGTPVVVMR